MKIGKIENGAIAVKVVDANNVDKYLADGWKLVSESEKSSESAELIHQDVSNGWIEVWKEPTTEVEPREVEIE